MVLPPPRSPFETRLPSVFLSLKTVGGLGFEQTDNATRGDAHASFQPGLVNVQPKAQTPNKIDPGTQLAAVLWRSFNKTVRNDNID